MKDPDIILYLYPNDGPGREAAEDAIAMPQNSSKYMPPRQPNAASRSYRESTEPPEEYRSLERSPCLVLRFSDGAKTGHGIMAGWGDNVDVSLPKRRGISRCHFAFTFDDKNRLIARDLGSKHGIRVVYDEEKGDFQSKIDYLLQAPSILRTEHLVLYVGPGFQIKVVVPSHDVTSQDYFDRVTKFRQGWAHPEDLLDGLALLSAPRTQAPTGAQTPTDVSVPVLYRKELGQGSFGVVSYVWNATTGEEYALKEPHKNNTENNNFDMEAWKKEAKMMGRISHRHIVAFRDAKFDPYPQLTFEFVPGGSLDAYRDFSTFENTQVLCQLLSALRYLHERTPPIAHRDIKPENILVAFRRSGSIHVKFGDFGLATAADRLATICGTWVWAAPEIYQKQFGRIDREDQYTVAVDIWSLGLVIASQEYGLPQRVTSHEHSAVAWIQDALWHFKSFFRKERNELLRFVLDSMLIENPRKRKSASQCMEEAMQLPN
ncbi:putative serine/threonine protein kinase, partial [Lentithecium fluviatile CBS 122367]